MDSPSVLQGQINSLGAVVLQNRRGLDILTPSQGGMCAMLQEQCCFGVNHLRQISADIQYFLDKAK